MSQVAYRISGDQAVHPRPRFAIRSGKPEFRTALALAPTGEKNSAWHCFRLRNTVRHCALRGSAATQRAEPALPSFPRKRESSGKFARKRAPETVSSLTGRYVKK